MTKVNHHGPMPTVNTLYPQLLEAGDTALFASPAQLQVADNSLWEMYDENPSEICVVSCVPDGVPTPSLLSLAEALQSVAPTRLVLLCEHTQVADLPSWCQTVQTPSGTKLSKLRTFIEFCGDSLICICDPDMRLVTKQAVHVVRRALDQVKTDKNVVAYGIVAAEPGRGWLSELVALDKLWSHRVLRPLLWRLGMGITLPGQFLVLSSHLLGQLDPSIDTYLDDLYLGILVRTASSVRCIREPVTVGYERCRRSWLGLVAQRIRWMKGFRALLHAFRRRPQIVGYLGVHFLAYHGLPVLALATLVACFAFFPWAALLVSVGLVAGTSLLTRRAPAAICLYLILFPCLHLLVTLTAGIPFSRPFLTRD